LTFYKFFTISIFVIAIGVFSSTSYVFSESSTQITILAGTSTPSCGESNSCYSNFKTMIGQGSKVIWVNQDSQPHTITSGNPFEGADKNFDSGLIKVGGSFSKTLSKQGTFDYFCQLHPWAIGLVVVGDADYTAPDPTPDPTPAPTPSPTPAPTSDKIISPDLISSGTGEQLKIQVNLSENDSGANITINVFDADGNIVFTKMVTVDSNIADVAFSVSGNSIASSSTVPSVTNKESQDSIISVEPTCGTGTELVNGICHMIKKSESLRVDNVPTELINTKNAKPILECGAGTEPVNGKCQVIKDDTTNSNRNTCFLFWCW